MEHRSKLLQCDRICACYMEGDMKRLQFAGRKFLNGMKELKGSYHEAD